MPSPIHRLVSELAESRVLAPVLDQLPLEARNALGYFAADATPSLIRRGPLSEGDVAGGVAVFLGQVQQGASLGGVNLLKGTIAGGTLRGCNLGVADVLDGDVRGINVLVGDVLGGDVVVKIHIGDVLGGSVEAETHATEVVPADESG